MKREAVIRGYHFILLLGVWFGKQLEGMLVSPSVLMVRTVSCSPLELLDAGSRPPTGGQQEGWPGTSSASLCFS